MNSLVELRNQGQSIWLDYISRGMIKTGQLRSLIENYGLRGVTSNPSIFEKAIDASTDYDSDLAKLIERSPRSGPRRFTMNWRSRMCATQRTSCVRVRSKRRRRRICKPGAASAAYPRYFLDPGGSTAAVEGRRTAEPDDQGRRHARRGQGRGDAHFRGNQHQYHADVLDASLRSRHRGVHPRTGAMQPAGEDRFRRIVFREPRRYKELDAKGSTDALSLRGTIAIANAKMVYRRFWEIFYGNAFSGLRSRGARVQRPLWASTSTKNPRYRDVLYVEEMIGPETVNTIPLATLEAFREHGRVPGATVLEDWAGAEERLGRLAAVGIDLNAVAEKLQADGIELFGESYSKVLAALERKREAIVATAH